MGVGDLDSGTRFGLPPIGLDQATLDTGRSDTQRRQMPGLATKSSVFAWQSPTVIISTQSAVGGIVNLSINLRNNAAPGGSSVVVPVWAAGAVCTLQTSVNAMGTSTYHQWYVQPSLALSAAYVAADIQTAALTAFRAQQFVTPFFDEPEFILNQSTNGTGTANHTIYLLGFVRNV